MRRPAGIPKRLVFVMLAAMLAFVTQFAMQHRDRVPDFNLSNWIGPTPAPIAGVASVIDGDTIEIRGQRIRFNGIDAPESRQYCDDAKGFEYPCGRRAADALDTFLATSRPVQCRFVTWDRYDRFVGDCRRADGASVAAWMVEHGQALDWPRYSHGAYESQQAKAKAAKLGLWAGTFQTPWNWRAQHTENTPPVASQPLGIISRRQVAQSYFVPAAANLLANRFVRRSPMVSQQLLLGRQAGSRWRRCGVRNSLLNDRYSRCRSP